MHFAFAPAIDLIAFFARAMSSAVSSWLSELSLASSFVEHPAKTRVMRQASHQEVTGVTVNTRPTIARKKIRTLRAILHNAAKHGLASQNRANDPHFVETLRGQIAFVCMIDPERGLPMREAFKKLVSAQ